MPDKTEKNSRKQLLNDLRKNASEEFENSLPVSRDMFKRLFDYLDAEFGAIECDHTNRLIRSFLEQTGVANNQAVLDWLAGRGGYCDCEILSNVEEQFE